MLPAVASAVHGDDSGVGFESHPLRCFRSELATSGIAAARATRVPNRERLLAGSCGGDDEFALLRISSSSRAECERDSHQDRREQHGKIFHVSPLSPRRAARLDQAASTPPLASIGDFPDRLLTAPMVRLVPLGDEPSIC
jgi:hypothetical protein